MFESKKNHEQQKISIIIPAYNEELRIANMLTAYIHYFRNVPEYIEFVVVLNGCTDNTRTIVEKFIAHYAGHVRMLEIRQAGKGLALKVGFNDALKRPNDLIGFVDADMATQPRYFYDLIQAIENYDGVIASRYMPGAYVVPLRPWVKRWGSWLIYEFMVFLFFGLRFYDYQCGAKLFRRTLIAKIIPYLSVPQFAFDVELLYLCKKFGARIKEIPTVWYDQEGSKLRIFKNGFAMLGTLIKLRVRYVPFKKLQ